jgi:hypothetical protein
MDENWDHLKVRQLSKAEWTMANLLGWIKRKIEVGKVPLIKKHLADLYPNGVPDPAFLHRDILRADLLKRDPTLDPLDYKTLRKAIRQHNAARS